jgi:hypothetical protein
MHHPNEPAAPEAPRRRFRKLRIAWSVGCVVVAALLITLWVGSYQYYESVLSSFGNVTSVQGTVVCNYFDFWYAIKHGPGDWALTQGAAERWSNNAPMKRWPGLLLYRHRNGVPCLELQHWFLIALCGLCCVAPWQSWLRWRFSLRTMLIATTLVAVVLGILALSN